MVTVSENYIMEKVKNSGERNQRNAQKNLPIQETFHKPSM
jgi:hypothetical protein